MRHRAREEGRCGILPEARVPQRAALLHRGDPEAGEGERMPRRRRLALREVGHGVGATRGAG